MIPDDDVAQLLGVEPGGERRRADEVAEHDRQLPALARRELDALAVAGRGRLACGQARAAFPAELLRSFDARSTRRTGRSEPCTALGAEAALRTVLTPAGWARHPLGSVRERSCSGRGVHGAVFHADRLVSQLARDRVTPGRQTRRSMEIDGNRPPTGTRTGTAPMTVLRRTRWSGSVPFIASAEGRGGGQTAAVPAGPRRAARRSLTARRPRPPPAAGGNPL